MKNDIRIPHPVQKWQPYAVLEFQAGEAAEDSLKSWLNDKLYSLGLSEGFSEKVIDSANDAFARVPNGISQVRLLLYLPASHKPVDQTWGFFRMLKNGGMPEGPPAENYQIIFYLYTEGSVQPD